jgi:hypothetical protein
LYFKRVDTDTYSVDIGVGCVSLYESTRAFPVAMNIAFTSDPIPLLDIFTGKLYLGVALTLEYGSF